MCVCVCVRERERIIGRMRERRPNDLIPSSDPYRPAILQFLSLVEFYRKKSEDDGIEVISFLRGGSVNPGGYLLAQAAETVNIYPNTQVE